MVNNPLLKRLWQRPHWFQETQFVNYDDILWVQAELGSFSLKTKCVCVCVCVWAHARTLACIEERNEDLWAMGWLRPKFMWALPDWHWCPLPPSSSRRPGEMPWTAAPFCLLTSWRLLLYLIMEENSLSLWVCCGFNKLHLFLPILKHYKKQQSGQVTASWEGSHKS